MAEPVSATLVGTAVVGAVIGAEGQRNAARQKAQAAKRNAANMELQAQEMIQRAEINAKLAQKEGRQLLGDQVSSMAGNGLDVTTGSPLLLMEDTLRMVNEEMENIRRDALFDAGQARLAAMEDRRLASQLKKGSNMEYAGSLLSSVANIGLAAGYGTPKKG